EVTAANCGLREKRAQWPPPAFLRSAGRLCPRPARVLGLIRNSPAGIDARLRANVGSGQFYAVSGFDFGSLSTLCGMTRMQPLCWRRHGLFIRGDTTTPRTPGCRLRPSFMTFDVALGTQVAAFRCATFVKLAQGQTQT